MNKVTQGLPLSSYRALDLTTENGYFCGKILADLGMDVIMLEPPCGSSGRNIGPFYHDEPDNEKGLFFFANNTSKRSITLDIESSDGQDIFRKLVKTAHFVIESFAPDYLKGLGLDYPALKEINAGIIMVSITPFGQTGPYKNWKASDIVSIAMGGLSHITGSPDRPPARICVDQAHLVAGAHAAMGALIASYYRAVTGQGQHVDTSAQESAVISALTVPQAWDLEKFVWPRVGACLPRSGKRVRHIWACKDGFIAWRIFGGGLGVKTRALAAWIDEENQAGELKDVNWEQMDYLSTGSVLFDRWQEIFAKFFKTHTKEELCRESLTRGIVLFPVSTPKDLLEDRQLRARGYWENIEHPELDTSFIYPGVLYRSSEYSQKIRRAPLLGEHNREIYEKELGFSRETMTILKNNKVI